jgi:hypothetical protein
MRARGTRTSMKFEVSEHAAIAWLKESDAGEERD